MSRFWPHTPYAEEQPYAHAILYTHVLTRAIQTGSIVGTGAGASIFLLRQLNVLKPQIPPSTFATTLLRSTGIGAVVGLGVLTVGLPMRMLGREDIEWKDRSWRLLENKGQVECDDWTYAGMAAGAVAATRGGASGWRGAVGKVGAGSVIGMLGYMGYRYGVKGGNWEETKVL
jgi:hypothetical protein